MEPIICIVGAIKEEIAAIRKAMVVQETRHTRSGSFWTGVFSGKNVVLVRSGVGKRYAAEALRQACDLFSPSFIISTGYAGGLVPQLCIGDLIVADKVLEFAPGSAVGFDGTQRVETLPILPFHIDKTFTVMRGGLLTVDEVVSKPEYKSALGKNYPVLAVEMETSALARIAQEKQLPFMSVRAISDTVDHELPDFTSMQDEKGEVSKLKAGWHVLTHPDSLKSMIELRKNSQKATASLTDFLSRFIQTVG